MACIEYGWSPWPDISFVSRRHFSSLPASEVALDRTVVAHYPVDQKSWCFLVLQSCNTKKLMFLGRGLHNCMQRRQIAGGWRCNAMQCRQGTKAGGGEEIHSPPPVAGISRFNGREVDATWGRAATLIASSSHMCTLCLFVCGKMHNAPSPPPWLYGGMSQGWFTASSIGGIASQTSPHLDHAQLERRLMQ